MKNRQLSDLKAQYVRTLDEIKELSDMGVKATPGDFAGFDLQKLMERNERVAKLHFDLLKIRNDVRARIDEAHFSGEDRRFRNEAMAFLSELKIDAKTVSEMSMLYSENARAVRQMLYRLTSNHD